MRCPKSLGGSLGASLSALMWSATAEAVSNFLITPPIPAAASCKITCSVVNLTSQTRAVMGVGVHDATNAEVDSGCFQCPGWSGMFRHRYGSHGRTIPLLLCVQCCSGARGFDPGVDLCRLWDQRRAHQNLPAGVVIGQSLTPRRLETSRPRNSGHPAPRADAAGSANRSPENPMNPRLTAARSSRRTSTVGRRSP